MTEALRGDGVGRSVFPMTGAMTDILARCDSNGTGERGGISGREDALLGVLLGTAVGDAIGLPREGLSARRAERLYGLSPLRHRLVLGRGMLSDDTEHACMTGQALLASGGDPRRFATSLAWRLRGWLLGLPAGVGAATARGILKLWVGFPPARSGVRSAGNGPAMRAAILGVHAADDLPALCELVRASTRLTHTHPDAEHGALAVALAARHGMLRGPDDIDAAALAEEVRALAGDGPVARWLASAAAELGRGATVAEVAASLGMHGRVTGYINHTVPVSLYAWLRTPGEVRAAVEAVVALGGDTDTTAAITGALVGATAGANAVPQEWLDGLVEWPRSVGWMRRLAARLAASRRATDSRPPRPLPLFWPALLPRNVLFLAVVLAHGFRRLLPPY